MVFGILFYLVNLLLVIQVVSIGNTITAERYTYVPYIGIAFLASMLIEKIKNTSYKNFAIAASVIVLIVFCKLTFDRTKIWKDSNTLWSDAISHYPKAHIPRNNRANYLCKLASDPKYQSQASGLFQIALEDCNVALKTQPHYVPSLETRGIIFEILNRNEEAVADGDSIIRLSPDYYKGYSIRGYAYMQMQQPEKAIADFSSSLRLKPDDDRALANRGMLYFNQFKKYDEALNDFDRALRITPSGNNFLSRSRCYYALGDLAKAKEDALMAQEKGITITDDYAKLLNIQ